MKGLNISLTLIVSFLVGIMVVMVVVAILNGNLSGLEDFALPNLEFGVGEGSN